MSSCCPHESCIMSSLKGLRNGIYYGGKVRFLHSLVMTILFKKDGTLFDKLKYILKLTLEHAKNLGLFVFCYKSFVCLLNRISNKQRKIHSLISGFIFGYLIFGKKTVINQQLVLYILSRIIYGAAVSL